jgi:hypothetical protein
MDISNDDWLNKEDMQTLPRINSILSIHDRRRTSRLIPPPPTQNDANLEEFQTGLVPKGKPQEYAITVRTQASL